MMAIPAIIYGVLSLTIPESPRFLIAKHRIDEAKVILSKLLGGTKPYRCEDRADPENDGARDRAVMARSENT